MERKFRELDASVQRDIHELFTRSAGNLLDHRFESDGVKAMLILSTLDDTLAPKGAHIASLFCQRFSYNLPDGRH